MKKVFISICSLIFTISTLQAQDNYLSKKSFQSKDDAAGYQEHDGFYLSMALGVVGGDIDYTYAGQKITFSGLGSDIDIKIGGAISSDIILFGMLTSKAVSGPDISNGVQTVTAPDNIGIGEGMLGGGIVHYTENNLFFSGAIGAGNFTLMDTNKSGSRSTTNRGVSFQLKFGKEWWVSDNWALGLNLNYSKTMVSNSSTSEELNSNRFGVQFCATFN